MEDFESGDPTSIGKWLKLPNMYSIMKEYMSEYHPESLIEPKDKILTLSRTSMITSDNKLILHAIPSGFHSDGIYNIAEINGVHSQLETWLTKFRGVSTRHFQEYLNWFVYVFIMKKRFMLNKIKTESYSKILTNDNYIKSKDIFNIKMPIDLRIAYAEYLNQS